jgi:hypothetical protein
LFAFLLPAWSTRAAPETTQRRRRSTSSWLATGAAHLCLLSGNTSPPAACTAMAISATTSGRQRWPALHHRDLIASGAGHSPSPRTEMAFEACKRVHAGERNPSALS